MQIIIPFSIYSFASSKRSVLVLVPTQYFFAIIDMIYCNQCIIKLVLVLRKIIL